MVNRFVLGILSVLFIEACSSTRYFPDDSISQKINVEKGDSLLELRYTTKDIRPSEKKRYYWIRKNHVSSTLGSYGGKLLHGEYRVFSPDAELWVSGQFDKGVMIGKWFFYDYGELVATKSYDNGELDRFVSYQDGEPIIERNFREGRLDGLFKRHIGDSVMKVTYIKGIPKDTLYVK